MKRLILIAIVSLSASLLVCGQPEFPSGSPLFPEIGKWHEISVDPQHAEAMRAVNQPKDQPFRFAIPVEVSLTPFNSGFIATRGSETIWVLPVSSKGALSLNVIFHLITLPRGAYIMFMITTADSAGSIHRESTSGTLTIRLCLFRGKADGMHSPYRILKTRWG